MLRHTHLQVLTCVVRCPNKETQKRFTDQIDSEESLARRAVVCVKTLKYVSFSITVTGVRAPPAVYWAISTQDNTEKTVTEVTDRDTAVVIERMFKIDVTVRSMIHSRSTTLISTLLHWSLSCALKVRDI